jgi:hypothetical protein
MIHGLLGYDTDTGGEKSNKARLSKASPLDAPQ